VHKEVPPALQQTTGKPAGIDAIRKRGVLRVGYHPDSLPFAFFNAADVLVGLDVVMANQLARDLEVDLEFVPFTFDTLAEQLNRGQFDLAMSGIAMTASRSEQMHFSDPYLDLNFALVVRDHRRSVFQSLEAIHAMDAVRVAIVEDRSMRRAIETNVPRAEVVAVASLRDFFEADPEPADVLLTSAETGSAWTLMHPGFDVVIPQPGIGRIPVGYAVARGNRDLLVFVNNWVQIQRNGPELPAAFDRWVMGKGAEEKKPRWSLLQYFLKPE
jgi:ABC-type amino acid transport substrate-binding protein